MSSLLVLAFTELFRFCAVDQSGWGKGDKGMFRVSGLALAVGVGSLLLTVDSADAKLTLTLISGMSTVTVVDGEAGDPDGAENNFINFAGSVGGFTLQGTTTGSSSPNGRGEILGLTNFTFNGSGEITIIAADDSFSPGGEDLPVLLAASQTAMGQTGSVEAGFDGNPPLLTVSMTGNDAAEDTTTVDLSSPFTAFIRATINKTGATSSQFNSSLNVVPLPASALLLLGGLGALGLAARRRRDAVTA